MPEEIKDDGDNGVTVSERYNGKEGDQRRSWDLDDKGPCEP